MLKWYGKWERLHYTWKWFLEADILKRKSQSL